MIEISFSFQKTPAMLVFSVYMVYDGIRRDLWKKLTKKEISSALFRLSPL